VKEIGEKRAREKGNFATGEVQQQTLWEVGKGKPPYKK